MYPDRKEQCSKVNKTKVGDINPRSHFNYQAQRKTTLLNSQNCWGDIKLLYFHQQIEKGIIRDKKLVSANEFCLKVSECTFQCCVPNRLDG